MLEERQRPDRGFRRARMLLVGLGILDIDRLIEFREPTLRSQEGKVQGKLSLVTRRHVVIRLKFCLQSTSLKSRQVLEDLR